MGSCCGSRLAEQTSEPDAPSRGRHAPHKLAACGRGGAKQSGACCEECGEKESSPKSRAARAVPAGQQFDPLIHSLLQGRFGHSFGKVSVMTDERAVRSAQTYSLGRGASPPGPWPGDPAAEGKSSRKMRQTARALEGMELAADVSIVRPASAGKGAILSVGGEAVGEEEGGAIKLAEEGPGAGAKADAGAEAPVPAKKAPSCTYKITYANLKKEDCGAGRCGAKIVYDVTKVTATGDGCPPKLEGLRVTEEVDTDEGCAPGKVTTGPGCLIEAGGKVEAGCTDTYAICAKPETYPAAGCTEVYTQRIYVGGKLAETRKITFKITKTKGGACSGTVTRT